MSRNFFSELDYQNAILSINPLTNLPYSTSLMQVADGQGTRRWQSVFTTISSQSGQDSANLGYLPSTIFSISNDNASISTVLATSFSTLSTQIGNGGIPGSITSGQLQSTVYWIQNTAMYTSTGDLTSTVTSFTSGSLSYASSLQSTVIGLGTVRYISSTQLVSTVTGLNNQSRSTTSGLGTFGYTSTLSLQSTVAGLAQANYASTSMIVSTVTGLLYPITSPGGNLGVVVTGTTDPPFKNFTTLTATYLGANNYVNTANAAGYGFVFGSQLPSTTLGVISTLGSYSYVSTPTLLSTSAGIQAAKQNVFIDIAGGTSIYNSQVYISTVAAITFLSSFINSSIIYQGNNGVIGASTTTSNLFFSTANLQFDRFSSLITSNSRITFEVYPTFAFDRLTLGALVSKSFLMETTIQYGTGFVNVSTQTYIPGISVTDGFSNYFQQPIKLTIPTGFITNYVHPYVLTHKITGGLSYLTNVGFRTSNVDIFFNSTQSYYLTLQNLTM